MHQMNNFKNRKTFKRRENTIVAIYVVSMLVIFTVHFLWVLYNFGFVDNMDQLMKINTYMNQILIDVLIVLSAILLYKLKYKYNYEYLRQRNSIIAFVCTEISYLVFMISFYYFNKQLQSISSITLICCIRSSIQAIGFLYFKLP